MSSSLRYEKSFYHIRWAPWSVTIFIKKKKKKKKKNVFVVRHVIYLFIIIPDEANMAKRWILNNN